MRHRIGWVTPFVFLAHDLEEAFQTGRLAAEADVIARRLPAPLGSLLSRVRYSRRRMSAFAFGALGAYFLLTRRARRSPRSAWLLRGALFARLVNGTTHIGESVALRRYVPGTATAPAVMLAAWLQLRAVRDRGARTSQA